MKWPIIFLIFLFTLPAWAIDKPLFRTTADVDSQKNFENIEYELNKLYNGKASLEVSSIVSSLETVALLDATSIEADGAFITTLTATDITAETGSFTTLQRTTPVTHTLVSSRMMWYGAMTVGDFSISEVRSISRAGNKTYAIDIPLSHGQKIITITAFFASNQTLGGTVKLQKALQFATSWTDVGSTNITAQGATTVTANYTIEDGYAVRALITYTATGGTYSYHYPMRVTWQQTTL